MRRHKLILMYIMLLCAVLLAGTTWADSSMSVSEEELFKDVTHEIVCTCGCGNQLLSDCVCSRANDWKNQLRTQIKTGKNRQQLLQWMSDKYGPEVLAAPPKEGINWILWVVVPYILPLFAAVGLGFLLSKWVRRSKLSQEQEQDETEPEAGERPEADTASEQYKKQLEDELKDFDE